MAEIKRNSFPLEKVGFAVYGIVCLILFTYIRFPWDTFRGRMEQSISTAINQPVTLGRVHAHFPFGFKADGMTINKTVKAKELIVRPHFLTLMTGSMGMDIKALFTTGSLVCSFDKPLGTARKPVKASIEMENFDSSLMHTLFATSVQPKGFITGKIRLAGPTPSLREMDGKADLVWKDGFFPLAGSQLPMDGIKFKTMEMNSRIEKGLVTLEKMDLKGDMSGNMNGSIRMMDPFSRSRLNLTGMISLSQGATPPMGAGIQQGMRFSLRGTLEKPRFRLLGSPR